MWNGWQDTSYRKPGTRRLCNPEHLQAGYRAGEDRAGVFACSDANRRCGGAGIEDVAVGEVVESVVDASQQPCSGRPENREPEPFHICRTCRESDGFHGVVVPGHDREVELVRVHALVCA